MDDPALTDRLNLLMVKFDTKYSTVRAYLTCTIPTPQTALAMSAHASEASTPETGDPEKVDEEGGAAAAEGAGHGGGAAEKSAPKDTDDDDSDSDDNLDLGDSEDDSADSDDEDPKVLKIQEEEKNLSPDEFLIARMTAAESLKKDANERFKAKDNACARDLYLDALLHLKHLKVKHLGSEDSRIAADSLRATLNCNLAAAYNNMKDWEPAIKCADSVLQVDPLSSKALFRRGFANFHRSVTGAYLKLARKDLVACVKADPKNKAARRLLMKVKAKQESLREEQRKAMAGMFDKPLYADVEQRREEERRRKADAKRKREEEEEALWKEESDRRKSAGESEISLEDFRKVLKDQKKEEERLAEERRKKQRDELRERQRKTDAEPVIVDAEEEGLLKGYKKTKDGRTTSYFTREIDEDAKRLLAQKSTPQKVDADPAGGARPITNQSSFSSWNAQRTTFEERDCTKRLKQLLKSHLVEIRSPAGQARTADHRGYGVDIEVTDVTSLEGSATEVHKSSGIGHLFEWTFKLSWTAHWSQQAASGGAEGGGNGGEDRPSGACKGWIKCTDVTDHSDLAGEGDWECSWGYGAGEKPADRELQDAIRSTTTCLRKSGLGKI